MLQFNNVLCYNLMPTSIMKWAATYGKGGLILKDISTFVLSYKRMKSLFSATLPAEMFGGVPVL